MKLNAKEMRTVDENMVKEQIASLKRHPVYFILENVYDTYNVGGLFRLADALGVSKMYLCGEMEIPPNPKIKKASIGTYKVVPWEYKRSAKEAINTLRNPKSQILNHKQILNSNNQIKIIAIEQDNKSIPYTQIECQLPIALILGNETYGVLPETLVYADSIVEIPMWGINKSLNVIVSAAIVSYHIMNKLVVISNDK